LANRIAIAVTIGTFAALGLLNGFYLPTLYAWHTGYFWAADIAHYVVAPLAFTWALARCGVSPAQYGYTSLPASLNLFEKAMLLLGVCALFTLAYWPVRKVAEAYLAGHVASFGYGTALPAGGWLRVAAVVYLAATAALVEETIFRGLPWRYMRAHTRVMVGAYVLLTAAAFAVVHIEQGPAGVIASFSLGLASAILYAKLQNLWPLVGAHFITDMWAYW
jgi:membrane protease YdiL (CAAX protease family)